MKPNRHQRRAKEAIDKTIDSKNTKENQRRVLNYDKLQKWYSSQNKLSQIEADEVFKRMTKKLLKKDIKDGVEFQLLLNACVKSLIEHPIKEVSDENKN